MPKSKALKGRSGDRWGQCAALPIRFYDGSVQALLLTSRETKRWVIPKGWPMRRLSAADTALREAFEEAGVLGALAGPDAIGRYTYSKVLPDRSERLVLVEVFLMLVERQAESWPEQAERQTVWVDAETAASMVAEPELAAIFSRLDATTLAAA